MKWWLLTGIGLIPFVFNPWAEIPFEVPKVWFLWRWIEILTVIGFLGSIYRLKNIKLDNKLLGLMVVWLGVMVAASWFGSDWVKSVWGNAYRIDGLLTVFHLAILAVLVGIYWQKTWETDLGKVLRSSLWVTVIWLVLNLGKMAGFGQPNFLGGYMAVSLPLLSVWWWLAGIVIFLTQSIGAVATLFLFGLVSLLSQRRRLGLVMLSLFLIFMTGGVVWLLNGQRVSAESRERIFHRALMGWQKRPVLGWGVANVDHAIQSADWPMPVLHDVYVDKAHSTILESLVTTGVIGSLVYLTLTGYLGWRLYHRKEYVWLTVLILYFFHAQTNVISIAEEIYFWLALGVGMRKD